MVCLLPALVYLLLVDLCPWIFGPGRGGDGKEGQIWFTEDIFYQFTTFPLSSPTFTYKTIDVECCDTRVDNGGAHIERKYA